MGRKGRPDPRSSDPSVFYFLNISVFYTFFSSRINDPKASLWLGLMDVISVDAKAINNINNTFLDSKPNP